MSITELLQKHRWNEWVILMFANNAEDKNLKTQWQSRQKDLQKYSERDLVTYLILTGEVLNDSRERISEQGAAALRQRFEVRPDEFRVILLAKDGSEKINSSFPVSSQQLFATVDAAPL